jgi:hypothetical protein
LVAIGPVVSEEKIKMWNVDRQTTDDGRQAKNKKKGDAILIVYCCFSASQNELKLQLHGKE